MNVFKRGNIWWGRWSVNGETIRMSSKTSDEKLARRYLADEYAKSFREKKLGEKPRRTWTEAVDAYLADRNHLKSIHSYEYHREWWDAEFKRRNLIYLDQLEPDVIKKIRDEELARPKLRGGGQRSPADVNRKIALLRAVMHAAYSEYRWFDGVAPLYRFVPGGSIERIRHLNPDEVTRLAKAMPEQYRDLVYMAVATGLRRRNVLRMRWDQIDLGTRTIRVDGVEMKNGQTLVLPLNQAAVDVLNRRKNNGSPWVFPLNGNKPLNEISSKVWSAACQKAGLEDLRWHDLRHTWASSLRKSGVEISVLRELGGWKDVRMVERYAHLDIDHLREAAERIGNAFKEAGAPRKVG
jgi:integrase